MSVVKSVWQNWETGLDFRTRIDRAHCVLGNIIDTMHDPILHMINDGQDPIMVIASIINQVSPSKNKLIEIWFKGLLSSSSLALSIPLCVSQSHLLYYQLCKYTVYLEGSLSTASAGRQKQKKCEGFDLGHKQGLYYYESGNQCGIYRSDQ